MLRVRLKRNPEYPKHSMEKTPRYFFELDLSGVIKGGGQATLPVYWRPNTLWKEGRNTFYDSEGYALLSQQALYFIGGLLKHSPALLALEDDHDFLVKGEVFTEDLIATWCEYKRKKESDAVRLRPHPSEFYLYFDT